ncbi:MAG: 4Fe-4S ferredoxin [Gammaproteobacteria bacterium]|nr:4Fe-4S ferredoxin [Gammaproteobacteria bacterium]
MNEDIYRKLAKVLDSLPQGFPATESGVEMKLLKKVFSPGEADLFCDLKLTPETVEQIAGRTGRSLDSFSETLNSMGMRGLAVMEPAEDGVLFGINQWLWIHDDQVPFQDEEFAALSDAYLPTFMPQLMENNPRFHRTIPVETQITDCRETMSFNSLSKLLEGHQSFAAHDCVCRIEKRMIGQGCDHGVGGCLTIAAEPGAFDDFDDIPGFDVISKEQAHELLLKFEEDGLVHQVSNTIGDQIYICNCCGCCCQFLAHVNQANMSDNWALVNSNFYAKIDADGCIACGVCKDERCQVNAIKEGEKAYLVAKRKCIGCGLCASTCPTDAIRMVMKKHEELVLPLKNEAEWNKARGRARGVDFSGYL